MNWTAHAKLNQHVGRKGDDDGTNHWVFKWCKSGEKEKRRGKK